MDKKQLEECPACLHHLENGFCTNFDCDKSGQYMSEICMCGWHLYEHDGKKYCVNLECSVLEIRGKIIEHGDRAAKVKIIELAYANLNDDGYSDYLHYYENERREGC